jgi:hypothetical protein
MVMIIVYLLLLVTSIEEHALEVYITYVYRHRDEQSTQDGVQHCSDDVVLSTST